MSLQNVRWFKYFQCCHWAFGMLAVATTVSLASCKPALKTSQLPTSEEICSVDDDLLLDEERSFVAVRCHADNRRDRPVLYAHYLVQPNTSEMCFDDEIQDSRGTINCAPGPVLLAHGNSVDNKDREWTLSSMPDYFAWQLDGKASIDEVLYIANANGLPIKGQSVKLENERERTLVLFPTTALVPGTKYYLYLVRTTVESTQRWIQPVVTTAGN